jgi:tetratricopeptide (TPR) repeat protein/DNA-binding winged helix-turn-helix (wHTH) protein
MRSPTRKPAYYLQDTTVDPGRGCLTRNGKEIYLRQQAFAVLLFLLENRHRLVTKQDLMDGIWPGIAVTDNALVQCIVEIRRALGDDFHHPRVIKTVPKMGYRVIGHVEELCDEPPHFPESALTASSLDRNTAMEPIGGVLLHGALAQSGGNSPRRRGRMWSAVLVFAGSLAVVLWMLYRPFGLPRAETALPHVAGKKPIAIMYFENESPRREFDWLREGLTDMLITDLARSDNLVVLSRQQLHILLDHIGHKPTENIRIEEALEIARRSHAEDVVIGHFAVLGNEVRLDVQVQDARNGQLIAGDSVVVSTLGDILTQVDFLALRLADQLGGGRRESAKQTGLSQMMTDNLEAYRYYSLGVEKAQAFENTHAIRLLQKAIDLDPKFAMAYARIGYAYAVTDFVPEKGTPYLEKAFHLSERLSEKDKLYLTCWYAIARTDYAAAIQTLRQIIAQYPAESEAYWRLARLLQGEEQPREAVRVLLQGLSIDPDAKDLYNGLGVNYLVLGQYDEAIRAHQRYVELAPREPNAYDSLGMSYQRSGRYQRAIEAYSNAVAFDSEFEPAIIHLGDAYFQLGRYRDAVRQYRRYIRVTRSDVARGLGYSNIAHVYLSEGKLSLAEWAARNEVKYAPGSLWNSLLIALQRNNTRQVEALKQRLFEQPPYSERGARADLRTLDYFRGYLALKNGGSTEEAIEYFREALRHLPPTSGIELHDDCLANAYLDLGRVDEAIEEYQRILAVNPNYPLISFHLAQAYEQKADQVQARSFYSRFLRDWSQADPTLPQIKDAHRALARLSL